MDTAAYLSVKRARAMHAAVSAVLEALLFAAAPFAAFMHGPPQRTALLCLAVLPLALFPAACFALGAFTGARSGFNLQQSLLSGLVFVPAAILHYGSPAWLCAGGYALSSALGMLIGAFFRKIKSCSRSRRKQRNDCSVIR